MREILLLPKTKHMRKNLLKTKTTFKPWQSWEDYQKSKEKLLPAFREKSTPVGTLTCTPAVEDISADTPAGFLSEENVPAVASTAPCTPAAAGRGGCRQAAARSVNHTPVCLGMGWAGRA